jgi:hypothetical protein
MNGRHKKIMTKSQSEILGHKVLQVPLLEHW